MALAFNGRLVSRVAEAWICANAVFTIPEQYSGQRNT
ncbi:hypothetical protein ILFOPFJJ_05483 [Ensifer psoraleae]|nr:hypothetical protein [Sinorhizobium psoraleae]